MTHNTTADVHCHDLFEPWTGNALRSSAGASATRKTPKIVSTSASGALAVSHPQLGPEGDR
jgi:hypothetical protein